MLHDIWRQGCSSSSSWVASPLTQALRQVLVNDWLCNTLSYPVSTHCPQAVFFQVKHLLVRSCSSTSQNTDSLAMLCCPLGESFFSTTYDRTYVELINKCSFCKSSATIEVVMVKDGRARGSLEWKPMTFPYISYFLRFLQIVHAWYKASDLWPSSRSLQRFGSQGLSKLSKASGLLCLFPTWFSHGPYQSVLGSHCSCWIQLLRCERWLSLNG